MFISLLTLSLVVVGFIWSRIRADIVALLGLVFLTVSGVISTQEALSGFANPIVIMMAGLFVVGGAIFNTGLAKMLGMGLLKLGGGNQTKLFIVVVMATGLIGGFVSNTGTVALMLPIVVSMAAASGTSASRLLMPLAFASSLGGMLTLIGTPPNLVIAEIWEETVNRPLTMFSFLPTGAICLVVGTLLLLPLSKKLSRKSSAETNTDKRRRSLSDIVDEYGLNDNLWKVRIPSSSPIAGLTLGNLALRNNYNLDVLELRTGDQSRRLIKNITQETPIADSTVEPGVVLFVRGSKEGVDQFVSDYGLELDVNTEGVRHNLRFYDIGVAEIVPMPESTIIGKTIADLDFRNRFNVNILGVRRGGRYITENLPLLKVREKDVLLTQGTWSAIEYLSKDTRHWVVLGQPLSEASKVTIDYKAPVAAVVMLAMIVMLVLDIVPAVMTVIMAALIMVLTGCFRTVAYAYKTINWESIVLIAAMMPMSVALEKTGVSDMVSSALVTHLGSLGPHWLLAGLYFTTSLMTLFISNTATAVLMAPIAMQSALAYGVSPLPLLFAVTYGASLCFASPFSTPPNALVMSAGQYSFIDYVKVGAPLQIILGILMIFVLPLFFPF